MNSQPHAYARLSPDLVLDAVESIGYRCDARILALNSFENRVFQIGIEDDVPIIGKFYRPARWSDAQIIEEHRFTQELYDLEIPVVPPLVIDGDSTLSSHENYRFSLYARRGGRAPALDDPGILPVLGRFIGRIHAAGKASCFEYRPTVDVESYAVAARTFLLDENFIPMELISAYESVSSELIDKCQAAFDRCQDSNLIRLHGDCHMGNVLWRDELPHFVDFDDARMGPAIQDLWMLLSGHHDYQSMQMKKILEGYTQFCDFDPMELHLIEALRTMRIMRHSGWIARRWDDPAFPLAFPWFNNQRYWSDHILELREQLSALDEPLLELY